MPRNPLSVDIPSLSLSPPYPDTTEGSANGKQKRVCTFVLNIETSSQKSPPYTGIHIQYWHISRRSVYRRGPWRHAARPRPRPLSNIRTLREMAIHGMPKVISLSLSRATVQPSPVYISDKTRIYHPPSPLSSRLISARFRSKAICGSGGREGGGEVDGVWPPGGSWTIIGESGWIEISRSSDDLRYVPWNF